MSENLCMCVLSSCNHTLFKNSVKSLNDKINSYLLDPTEGKKGNFAGSKWSTPVAPAAFICLHMVLTSKLV